jgi:hypothetical protein
MIMKKLFSFAPIIVFAFFFIACNQNTPSAKSSNDKKSAPATIEAKYQCPMDTEVVSNKPGTCPKCGMDLEKVK